MGGECRMSEGGDNRLQGFDGETERIRQLRNVKLAVHIVTTELPSFKSLL
jgi:hypothetical protein